MSERYERTFVPHQATLKATREAQALQKAVPSPLEGLGEGSRCPRPYCGGLLILRAVVTMDGSCDELVCSSCSRSRVVAVREPYRPVKREADGRVELLLSPPRVRDFGSESDDSMGIVLPPDVLARADLEGGWHDECPPDLPPD